MLHIGPLAASVADALKIQRDEAVPQPYVIPKLHCGQDVAAEVVGDRTQPGTGIAGSRQSILQRGLPLPELKDEGLLIHRTDFSLALASSLHLTLMRQHVQFLSSYDRINKREGDAYRCCVLPLCCVYRVAYAQAAVADGISK